MRRLALDVCLEPPRLCRGTHRLTRKLPQIARCKLAQWGGERACELSTRIGVLMERALHYNAPKTEAQYTSCKPSYRAPEITEGA